LHSEDVFPSLISYTINSKSLAKEKVINLDLPKLSERLIEFLNGKDLESKQHEAMMLLTVTEDGWPHNAMISVGEVIALDEQSFRLSLWQNTTTTLNILRTGKATLVVVYDGIVYYMRLALERLEDLQNAKHPLQRFTAAIISYREDMAKYADITSGIQIQLKDPDSVLKRWKETLEELGR
jgi:hypothetical protein